jgi:hypothetical protein
VDAARGLHVGDRARRRRVRRGRRLLTSTRRPVLKQSTPNVIHVHTHIQSQRAHIPHVSSYQRGSWGHARASSHIIRNQQLSTPLTPFVSGFSFRSTWAWHALRLSASPAVGRGQLGRAVIDGLAQPWLGGAAARGLSLRLATAWYTMLHILIITFTHNTARRHHRSQRWRRTLSAGFE